MNNKIILLQNAELEKDEMLHSKNLALSPLWSRTVENLYNTGAFDNINMIISSQYKSSYLTAYPLAKRLGKNIIQMKEFDEINRNKDIQLTKEEYYNLNIQSFEDIDFTKYWWEPSRKWLERIVKWIWLLQKNNYDKNILVISHPIILNLYFAYMTDNIYEIQNRWHRCKPCSYGVINGNKVLKDIV